jgi:hypothetical protein
MWGGCEGASGAEDSSIRSEWRGGSGRVYIASWACSSRSSASSSSSSIVCAGVFTATTVPVSQYSPGMDARVRTCRWCTREMHGCGICTFESLVQLLLLQRLQLVRQFRVVHLQQVSSVSIGTRSRSRARLTSMPMPAGLEMASEISFVSSSWLRTSSIVASTLSTLLQPTCQLPALSCATNDRSTHSLPWMVLRTLAPFFMASIVAMFMFADSIAFTCEQQSRGVEVSSERAGSSRGGSLSAPVSRA